MIHTTVLLEMRYGRRDTLVVGMPSVQCSDIDVDNDIWEPGLFSDTVARQLIDNSRKDPIPYPRKLLYMLQLKQGKACVRQVPNCRETLKSVIQAQLEPSNTCGVDEFAVCFAYWVAFYEEETDSLRPTDLSERYRLEQPIFFPPLIRDEVLRKEFLTPERIKTLIRQLDGDRHISSDRKVNFGCWTEVVADLVECEHYQEIVIRELKIKHSQFAYSRSRLSHILQDNEDITAALRIVQALSRTPQGLRQLAETKGYIGALAAEALISLSVTEEVQFCENLRDSKIRAGLLAFDRWSMVDSQDPLLAAKYGTSHWVFNHLFTTSE
ncbi:hypothetical protein J3R83DRAFT_12524 [Lanmaoa asiatica]|nr:hypothetical protein J3R83DRAFT_12524 [Lanmaoa asiatica]